MLRQCAVAALATMSARPAHADWRFTRWGMSPDQVVSASGRIARPVPRSADRDPGPAEVALPEMPYEARGVRFVARFLFDGEDHRLTRVVLSVGDDRDCPRLVDLLGERYGEPSRDDRAEVVRTTAWADARTMSLVTLSRLDAGGARGCVLGYEPLPGEDPSLRRAGRPRAEPPAPRPGWAGAVCADRDAVDRRGAHPPCRPIRSPT